MSKDLSERTGLTFSEWIAELEKDADVIHGYGVPLAETTGLECWKGFYDDGYTTREAILEDMTYWN